MSVEYQDHKRVHDFEEVQI